MEVVNRLESGWWDGFLGEMRGWFPSNYVAVISDEEAEELLYGEGDWMGVEMDNDGDRSASSSASGGGMLELAGGAETSDFWMPEVTSSGQVGVFSVHLYSLLTAYLDILREYAHRTEIQRSTAGCCKWISRC